MQLKKYIFFITFILIALFLSCEDKEWINPFDTNSDPKSWAPENLQIEQLSVTIVKLTWEQEEDNISGFKIDRKKGEESWQIEYAILDTNLTEWIDSSAVPDSMNYYRIYAFAKNNKSSIVENSICPEFPSPTDLQIQQLSVTELKLAWQDNSNGEDGFKVDKKVGNGAWQICYGIIKSNNTSWTDANAVSDQLNYYRLYAYVGDSKSSSVENSINPSFPAPSNLQINQLSDLEVKLIWQDNSAGEDGFKIDKKVGSGGWILGFGLVGSNIEEWIDTESVLNEINYYRVYGYSEESKSSGIEGNIIPSFPAPTNLFTNPVNDCKIEIQWEDNCYFEEGYRIARSENDNIFSNIAELESNTICYLDTGLVYGINYIYRVQAFTDNNSSAYTASDTSTTYFPAPTNLVVNPVNDSEIDLSWKDNCTFEKGYKIERSENSEDFINVDEVIHDVTVYTDTGLTYGSNYIYRVKAFTDNNFSDYAISETKTTYFPAPTSFNIESISDSEVELRWTEHPFNNVTGYKVERKINNDDFQEIHSGSNLNYNDIDIVKEKTYTYRIRAHTKNNVSDPSDSKIINWKNHFSHLWSGEHLNEIWSVDFSSDNSKVVSGGDIRIWNSENGDLTNRFWHTCLSVEFSPDNSKIVSGSGTRDNVMLWNAETGGLIWEGEHENNVNSVKFSQDNSKVVSGSSDYTIKLWDANNGDLLWTGMHSHLVLSLDFSSDNTMIVSGSADDTVRVWDVENGNILWTGNHTNFIRSADFSPDNTKVVSGSADHTFKVWNAETGELIWTGSNSGDVKSVKFSPDGLKVVSGGSDFKVKMWDAESGNLLWTGDHTDHVLSVNFSPDNSKVISGSFNSVKIWDAQKGNKIWSHSVGQVPCAIFSPDNKKIAFGKSSTLAEEYEIHVWIDDSYWQVSDGE